MKIRGLVMWLCGGMLCCVLGCVLLGCGPSAPPPSAPSPVVNKALPKFKRRSVRGHTVKTTQAPGQVVVVKFFAKYCKPCRKTLPATQRASLAHSDVAFIGISVDEFRRDTEEMINTYGLTFPVVHDQGGVLTGRFRVTQLPITFVADPSGTIRWAAGEMHSEDDLEAAIAWVQNGAQ